MIKVRVLSKVLKLNFVLVLLKMIIVLDQTGNLSSHNYHSRITLSINLVHFFSNVTLTFDVLSKKIFLISLCKSKDLILVAKMWFEIIPSFTIVALALAAPGYALYGIHKLYLGNVSKSNILFFIKPTLTLVYITKWN